MKLVTFTVGGRTSIGKVMDDKVIDLAEAIPDGPKTMIELLQGGQVTLDQISKVGLGGETVYPLSAVKLEAPVPNPQKFLAIGLNYQDHVDEIVARGGKAPENQMWFCKQVTCVTGPYDEVHKPKASERVDYEAELGVVIGERCRHVSEADALKVVAGYTVVNDFTARDWQRMSPQWMLAKSFDTHGPMGPWLVTRDEIPDPQALDMRLYVNGELRQKTNTRMMVFNVAAQIAYLSKVMTLEPGDVLATGTCAGAGWGMDPPQFLKAGDKVRVEIDGVGVIENPVIDEP
jgi:2-keto-4-pentenoate hydratase/2-oxohepta-3-ene-1,7-dioic acid hydratase in catechol pathway